MNNHDDSESIDATFVLNTVPNKPEMEANHVVINNREMFNAILNNTHRKQSAKTRVAPKKKLKLQ